MPHVTRQARVLLEGSINEVSKQSSAGPAPLGCIHAGAGMPTRVCQLQYTNMHNCLCILLPHLAGRQIGDRRLWGFCLEKVACWVARCQQHSPPVPENGLPKDATAGQCLAGTLPLGLQQAKPDIHARHHCISHRCIRRTSFPVFHDSCLWLPLQDDLRQMQCTVDVATHLRPASNYAGASAALFVGPVPEDKLP